MHIRERIKRVWRHIGLWFIKAILRPLFPCRPVGHRKVDARKQPVVFVCNHLEIYGPIVTALRMPFRHRPWIISEMLDRELIEAQLTSGVDRVFRALSEGFRRGLTRKLLPLISFVMVALNGIPVHHGSGREVLRTIEQTVEEMERRNNILLFPENPGGQEGGYVSEGVSRFHKGFAEIGRAYYKRTGRRALFVPVYVNKRKRTMTFLPGVRYDPDNPPAVEKERLAGCLHDTMVSAAQPAGQASA